MKKSQKTVTLGEVRAAVGPLNTLLENERLGTVTMFRLSELAGALDSPSTSAQKSIETARRRFVADHEEASESEILQAKESLQEELDEILEEKVKIQHYPIPATAIVVEAEDEEEDRTFIPGGGRTLLGLKPFLTDLDQLEDL